ncbi:MULTISPECIES: hypothetical protein [unclassified Nocardioides]|uniref:hypothetical protein n=1 Tax=unclassified Nocardioides TaxID=2615069 RepID=UPI000056FBA0|nr:MULTISPECIES: hypothetical protein [unclassified Nocardioides]ABL80969.1 hypothetical protein Noca_1455 [Nocardioides sp. JS614]
MAERLVLHVGTMKSGTTFLQNVVANNREALREQGVSFLGRKWREQIKAAQDAIERGGKGQPELSPDGPWARTVREVEAWPGTALFSVEFFGARKPSKIEQIVGSLGTTPVTVVLTVRDLARTIPSMWQESVQNGGRATWADYLVAVREERKDSALANSFWRQQGVAAMARRWAAVVGTENVVLVTAPPKGAPSNLLWDRYAGVLGVAPESCSLDVPANPSLGLASTLVLRRLNEELAAAPLSRGAYHQKVKRVLAKNGMARHRREEPVLGLDEPWVYQRSEREIAALRKLGCPVVGDLAELTSHPVPGVQPETVSVEQELEAAVRGLSHAVRDLTWAKTGKKK